MIKNEGTKILELILEEMKETRKDLNSMNVTLAKQHVTLEEHTRRSEALESLLDETRKEMKPVQKHVALVEGALKFLGLLGVIAGIIAAISEIIS